MSELLTIKQAAAIAGASDKTIRRWIESKKLPAQLVKGERGDQWMIMRGDVEAAAAAPKKKEPTKTAAGREKGTTGHTTSANRVSEESAEDIAEIRQLVEDLKESLIEKDDEPSAEVVELRQLVQEMKESLAKKNDEPSIEAVALKREVEALSATVAQLQYTLSEFQKALPARSETLIEQPKKKSFWSRLLRFE